jgi:hypothetical protein
MKRKRKSKKKRKLNLSISRIADLLYLSKKVVFHCSRINKPTGTFDPFIQVNLKEYIGFQGLDALDKLSDFFKTFHLDHDLFQLLRYVENKNLNDVAEKVRNVMRKII